MTTNLLSKNAAMRRMLYGRESQRIDARTGARSLWLGPARKLRAKMKVRGAPVDDREQLFRRALLMETVAVELASYLGPEDWRSDA